MDPVTPSIAEIVNKGARAERASIHTAIPGKVLSYNPTTQTADVEIGVKDFYFSEGERVYEVPGVLPSIPVVFPRGGGYVLVFPLSPGDFVWISYSERGLAEWRQAGEQSEPIDARRHSGWAVCQPGCYPDNKTIADASTGGLVLGKDASESQIRISPGEIKLGATASDFVALKTLVESELNAIRTLFNGHTHGGVTVGPGATGVPVPVFVGSAGSVGATVTKAK